MSNKVSDRNNKRKLDTNFNHVLDIQLLRMFENKNLAQDGSKFIINKYNIPEVKFIPQQYSYPETPTEIIKTSNIKVHKEKRWFMTWIIVALLTLILALGLGLGLGLKTSSSSLAPVTQSHTTPFGLSISAEDINNGKTTINNTEYSIIRQNDNVFLQVPAATYSVTPKTLTTKGMFGSTAGKTYNANTVLGEGKDNFYDINDLLPSLNMGVVRVTNHGKIYGGYVKKADNSGYVINDKLEILFPDGYEIGDFSKDGKGGINMEKLEKLILLRRSFILVTARDLESALRNAHTDTIYKFYKFFENGRTLINLVTNSHPEFPFQIGYAPTDGNLVYQNLWPGQSVNKPYWKDEITRPTVNEHKQQDYTFKVREFTKKDGTYHEFTLSKDNDDFNQEMRIPLNELYVPMTFTNGHLNHPVLGLIQPDPTGIFDFNNPSIQDENGNSPSVEMNDDDTLVLPTLLVKLEKI